MLPTKRLEMFQAFSLTKKRVAFFYIYDCFHMRGGNFKSQLFFRFVFLVREKKQGGPGYTDWSSDNM